MMRDIEGAVRTHRIIAILRGVGNDRIREVIDALYEGGIRLLEITYDQRSAARLADTPAAVSYAVEKYAGEMYVGAGTVMSAAEVSLAAQAGAEFVLSPHVDRGVIEKASELGIFAIPGAASPTEIAAAYSYGAGIVKLFPAGELGLPYCKAVMAPLSHIPLIAVGGVKLTNLKDFLDAGFLGAGIGSALTDRQMIAVGDYDGLRELAAAYMAAARESAGSDGR